MFIVSGKFDLILVELKNIVQSFLNILIYFVEGLIETATSIGNSFQGVIL